MIGLETVYIPMYIKRREKTKEEIEENKAESLKMRELFMEIWRERPHYSQVSGKWLGKEPSSIFFDHLLVKELYPQFKFEKENILLVTADEHVERTSGWPKPKHQEFIDEAKKKFLYAE
jgi:hypothetical protein